MTKPSNLASIEQATGRSWDDWVRLLDAANARNLVHRAIADIVHAELDGKTDNAGWWAQGVTVAYEQHIGRRVPGQVADGTFEVASSRTLAGSKEDVMALFEEAHSALSELNGTPIESSRLSGTDKRLYWKAELGDGSRSVVACEDKPGHKAMVVATQVKVASREQAESWRAFWKTRLAKL